MHIDHTTTTNTIGENMLPFKSNSYLYSSHVSPHDSMKFSVEHEKLKWILGRQADEEYEDLVEANKGSYLMWLSYRCNFPRLAPYSYTDDAGWGCMIRSGQMLLAQTLMRHHLGIEWHAPRDIESVKKEKPDTIKGEFIKNIFITSTMGISYKAGSK